MLIILTRRTMVPWGAAVLAGAALLVGFVQTGLAQTPVSPEELAAFKRSFREQAGPPRDAKAGVEETPAVRSASFAGMAGLSGGVTGIPEGTGGPRAGEVDLYQGLQPSDNGVWFYTSGGSELVYWALDDGQMGPEAAAAGGGHVTELEFAFGLHADVPNDILRPYIIVSFYNAPADPVASATNPVVEPSAPVVSIGFTFNPITLTSAGFYWFRTGLWDLTAAGLDFDLDDTFYVEILPLEWSSYPSGSPVFDPDVFAVFTGPGTVSYGVNQNKMWSDLWVRNGVCSPSVAGDGDGYYDHPAEMDVCDSATYRNQSGIILRGLECTGANTLRLSIDEPADFCVRPGEAVTVTLSQECLPGLVRGYQAFLSFDASRLSFDSGTYLTPWPYGQPIIFPIVAVGEEIDLAAGIDDPSGQLPTSSTADLVTLTFTAGTTEGLTSVAFGPHAPPTRFSDATGQPVVPTLIATPSICIDGTPPTITCPPDFGVQCPSEVPAPVSNYTEFTALGGSADDGGCCGSAVTVSHQGDTGNGGAGCPGSPLIITRTYRATDSAGNFAECAQTITVQDSTAPVISGLTVIGGEVDAACQKLVTFSAQVDDNCCILAASVLVDVSLLTGNATLGTPSITMTQADSNTVLISGSVLVSYLTGCPATVQVTIDGTDCCGNVATQAVQTADVNDVTAPVVTCPADVTIECDDAPLGWANGGILIAYNAGPENPGNQAWFRAQASKTNTNGSVFNFEPGPWGYGPAHPFQVHPDQHGLDFTLPAPTYNGTNPYTWFVAKDNVNGSCGGAASDGPHAWAISGYIPSPADLTGCVVNSVLRSDGIVTPPPPVVLTAWTVTQTGTVFTADVAGYLVSDNLVHWYTPAFPDTPMAGLGWNGQFYFRGRLVYNSQGDPGNDGDFYAGAIEVFANNPPTTTGWATATDNCDPGPVITFTDTFSGTCGLAGTITRTWKATDSCGNVSTCDQTITVQDATPPVVSGLTVNGGNVDDNCEFTVTFSATVADNCCVEAADVEVAVALPSGNASLGTPVITKTPINAFTVMISGSVVVSELTGCPATVQVTVGADDCCDNPATPAVQTAEVDDVTAPTFVGFPADRTQNADAGLCTAVLVPAIVPPSGADNCDAAPLVEYQRSDRINWNEGLTDAYPSGITTITWKVTDDCGNSITQNQTVTISASNELLVNVQLSPTMVAGPITRCITFELWNCATLQKETVSQELTFTNGLASNALVLVPCTKGPFTCITARDKLHTLRRTAACVDAGTNYTADFTGNPAGGGDWLVGGNLNDDSWIDILDFGVFSSQWVVTYGSGDTTCATSFPHADISGNGLVFTEDFTFIQVNFLKSHEANCCGAPGFRSGEEEGFEGPITEISVVELQQRGLGHLAAADLNRDGLLNQSDIAAFLMGVRPAPPTETPAPPSEAVPSQKPLKSSLGSADLTGTTPSRSSRP